jgi:hypothetical protein
MGGGAGSLSGGVQTGEIDGGLSTLATVAVSCWLVPLLWSGLE